MKTKIASFRAKGGYALILTMFMVGVCLLLLTTVFTWSFGSVANTARNNEYYNTANAAEAATEKVLVQMSRDYLANGEATLFGNVANYRTNYPSTNDNPYWGNFK